jgi:uncharacterized protein (TIGR00730 family)
MKRRVVTVFGSAHPSPGEPAYAVAYDIGRALADAGFVVCNGGYGGTMEASAKGAKEAGGVTIGVTAAEFGSRRPNLWIDTVVEVPTMVERLLELVRRGDAYVVLQGGTGTMLELAAVWEFIAKGLLPPRPILAVGEFWDGVVRTVREQLVAEGRETASHSVLLGGSAEECVDRLLRTFRGDQ